MLPQTTVYSNGPAPSEIKSSAEKIREIGRRKRCNAFRCIANAIPSASVRLVPFFIEESGEMNWRDLLKEKWTSDERLALQWLRSLFEEKMLVKPLLFSGLFPESADLKGAILCALASTYYASYFIDEYYLAKYGVELPSMLESPNAAGV